MEIKHRRIDGVFEITLEAISDNRGFFMRVFDDQIFEKSGINRKWVQENHSCTNRKDVIRGLHFQLPPFAETKLVRCTVGSILDVYVDLRSDSDTIGNWGSILLSRENKKMICIPRGFAHGFCTLTDYSEVQYKVDNYYSKEYEMGIAWNDSDLNIDWPTAQPILSDKDKRNISFRSFLKKYKGIHST